MPLKPYTRLAPTRTLVFHLLELGDAQAFRRQKPEDVMNIVIKRSERRVTVGQNLARRDYYAAAPPLDPRFPEAQWHLHGYYDADTFTDGVIFKHRLDDGEYTDDGERVMWGDAEGFHNEPKTEVEMVAVNEEISAIRRKPKP